MSLYHCPIEKERVRERQKDTFPHPHVCDISVRTRKCARTLTVWILVRVFFRQQIICKTCIQGFSQKVFYTFFMPIPSIKTLQLQYVEERPNSFFVPRYLLKVSQLPFKSCRNLGGVFLLIICGLEIKYVFCMITLDRN